MANEAPMTPEISLALGKAVAFVAARNKTHTPRILIGKDTRLSGYMIEQAIAAGICSMGARVILCGPIPTPAVAQLTDTIVVSASKSDTALIDAPATLSLVTSEVLASTPAQNYGDLLRALPGVNVIQLSARDINVTTHDTTVTLSGTVDSKAEHDRAMSLAHETAGVTKVIDDLHSR